MKKYTLVTLGLLALPFFAHAITLGGLLRKLSNILDSLVPLAIGLAVVLFLFGIIKYVTSGDSEEGRASARQMMLWGIIALFVMVSVWGLVEVLSQTTGIGTSGGGGTVVPGLP